MKRLLTALIIFLAGTGNGLAAVWEKNCEGCHNGTVAPTKEELLSQHPTPEDFLDAVKEAMREEKMPPGLKYLAAIKELFGRLPVKKAHAENSHGKVHESDEYSKYKRYFTPLPTLPPIPADNPLTPEKVKLGKMLYYDPRLSRSKIISCNTCHNIALGGDDNVKTSIGHGWKTGGRNAPTTLNSGFLKVQFWDGRAPTLEEQTKGPIQAHVEMNATPELVVRRLKAIPEYVELFKKAFPNDPDPVNFENVAKAIAAFERTLNTPNSPFQRYLLGEENALTKEQKEGMKLFVEKGCIACHNGPVLSDGRFHKFKSNNDTGRFRVTKNPKDKYLFRTPQLLNVALTAPYFHDGSAKTLEEAIRHMAEQELGQKLSMEEVRKIKAFLESLTGEIPLEARTVPILPPERQ
ncbi:cytochrome-c peroxidase [Phorcysia thermohydrogeniphila]|uniref:Cytochrome c peroxidase n=1 Tax=Phorcysia thermohydrogeniphila TaxID=936138 RepID=A0A4V2PDX3_9BACT|nr:cytochrome-c peroxidase [Phorcysia thermohydrogeniphila]TCK06646.1 cytochrome c peroxidase [Phorcysia thermohydrogeniphila]